MLTDFGRAAGGALIFSLPMLMTMEMWWLGFMIDPWRLVLLLVLTMPLLVGLAHVIGFEKTKGIANDILDSLIALGVAIIVSVTTLWLFGVIEGGMSAREILGKIAIQSVPAAIGALLASSQFTASDKRAVSDRQETYGGEMFLMAVGALFLGFNLAPTEEMVLISYQMNHWHAVGLVLASLALMHGFVFSFSFAGGTELTPDTPWWSAFVRFTLPGYLIALGISLYLLWTFGRTDDVAVAQILMAMVVLGLPAAVGAAAARLIL
jgi:putative integral membrane protein (TIGR02587 family)